MEVTRIRSASSWTGMLTEMGNRGTERSAPLAAGVSSLLSLSDSAANSTALVWGAAARDEAARANDGPTRSRTGAKRREGTRERGLFADQPPARSPVIHPCSDTQVEAGFVDWTSCDLWDAASASCADQLDEALCVFNAHASVAGHTMGAAGYAIAMEALR